MPGMSDYLENKVIDWLRAQAFPAAPVTLNIGLLTSIKGPRADATVYSLNDTFSMAAQDGKVHLYKVTVGGTSAAQRANLTVYAANTVVWITSNEGRKHLYKVTAGGGGTTAASQGTLFPGATGEVIVDSGITWTEQSLFYPGTANESMVDGTATCVEQDSGLDAATAGVLTEPTGNAYARQAITAALTALKSTQNDNLASTGNTGATSNSAGVNFPAPTPGAWGFVWGVAIWDAAGTNLLYWGPLSTAKTVNGGDAAPNFAIGALTVTVA